MLKARAQHERGKRAIAAELGRAHTRRDRAALPRARLPFGASIRRVVTAGVVTCLAVAAGATLSAQEVQRADSTHAAVAVATDGAPITVRVTSRRLPFMPGDLLMMNCSYAGAQGLIDLLPYACVRQARGTLTRLDADSVAFVRNGRTIRLAAHDVRRLEELTGRTALRTVGAGVMGGLAGVFGAAMIGIGGAYKNDAAFVATAVVLGTTGAVIGARRGGGAWKELPLSRTATR